MNASVEGETYCQPASEICGRTPGYVGKCGTADGCLWSVPYRGRACPKALTPLQDAAAQYKVAEGNKQIIGSNEEAILYVSGMPVAKICGGVIG